MGRNLTRRPNRNWRWGSTLVVGKKPDESLGLFSHNSERDLMRRATRRMAADGARRDSLEVGARAENPVARSLLADELHLRIFTGEALRGQEPTRCLRCGGKLTDGRCEGRWIRASVKEHMAWKRCAAIWTLATDGGLHASAATS